MTDFGISGRHPGFPAVFGRFMNRPYWISGNGVGVLRARACALGRFTNRPYGPAHPWRVDKS